MNIALVYKQSAGDGISQEELTGQLERSGHQVVQAVDADAESLSHVESGVELIVAAGGDGTIAEAAKAMAQSTVPLAILPRGTANNIAKSLGVRGAVPELIEGWQHASAVRFDLGAIQGVAGRRFVEGVGVGLVAEGIARSLRRKNEPHPDADAQLKADIRCYHDALMQLRPQPCSLSIDADDLSGDYILVEILNMSRIGPNLVLSNAVSPFDGLFGVVTAREEDRLAVLTYLEARIEGNSPSLDLPCRSATAVELQATGVMHVDDEIQRAAGPISCRIQPAAVNLLAPPQR